VNARDNIDRLFREGWARRRLPQGGRRKVSVASHLVPLDFKVINTGVGCEAFQLYIRGSELLLTKQGDVGLPETMESPCTLTIYWCDNPEERMAGPGDRAESMDFESVNEFLEYFKNDLEGDLSRA
jgi:hypothetical protein